MAYICGKYDILESALGRWFEKATGKTPEEYRDVDRKIVSLDIAITAEARRWVKDAFGPNWFGRQFVLEFDDRDNAQATIARPYRYLGFTGYSVEAIDEKTLRRVSLDGGPEIWSEIRKKVARAKPYHGAERLSFWGKDEDLSARSRVLHTIRLMLFDPEDDSTLRQRADEIDERLRRAPTLTLLYQSLTPDEKAELAHRINNPPVQAVVTENGRSRSLLLEPELEVLAMLERGEDVASPLHEWA